MAKEPINYVYVVGGLAVLSCFLTYCASFWDDPPEWWPECLQYDSDDSDDEHQEEKEEINKDKEEDLENGTDNEEQKLVDEQQNVEPTKVSEPVNPEMVTATVVGV